MLSQETITKVEHFAEAIDVKSFSRNLREMLILNMTSDSRLQDEIFFTDILMLFDILDRLEDDRVIND